MITVYTLIDEHLEQGDISALSPAAVWIDLLEPTSEEKEAVQAMLAIDIPTREEMQEIEASSRLYQEGEALYMTAPILSNVDSRRPQGSAITFILTRLCTITVRYATPLSFITFAHRATRQRNLCLTADAVLSGLMETIIDRIADIMERIGNDLDTISHQIFRPDYQDTDDKQQTKPRNDLQEILRSIGRNGDLSSKARDTILGIGRIITFLSQSDESLTRKEIRLRTKTMTRDIRSLTEHASFLSTKINFLLDATLGMINIEQNNIIKIFSVVAVVFLPPTLIASIYGMNFKSMPDLDLAYGYPMALMFMVISVAMPYLFFKRKGWL